MKLIQALRKTLEIGVLASIAVSSASAISFDGHVEMRDALGGSNSPDSSSGYFRTRLTGGLELVLGSYSHLAKSSDGEWFGTFCF